MEMYSWLSILSHFYIFVQSKHLPLTVGAADEQMLPWKKPHVQFQLIILIFIWCSFGDAPDFKQQLSTNA